VNLDLLSSCELCPHRCQVNRLKGELGFCRAGEDIVVYDYQLHLGEEPPLSGTRGSGTIFFSHCNSRCVYCQNYRFSQSGDGRKVTIRELAEMMLFLQKQGAHNINLVTATHFVPEIIAAFTISAENGLRVPIVYNTNGYELPETLKLLEGIVDIYLPDMRYSNDAAAQKYSSLPDYVSYNREAVKIMYQQVGDLQIKDGIATRGLIIRHLVLPNDIAGSRDTLTFIKNELSPAVAVSVMGQYYPLFQASRYPELNRQPTAAEYEPVLALVDELGLVNGWCQEIPDETDRNRFLGENF